MVPLGIRSAVRSLARRPVFSAAAILTIALGIGANSAVYSIVHAVLLSPLPFRDPDRLVDVRETHPELAAFQVAFPDFVDWQAGAHSFAGLAAYTFEAMNRATLLGQGEPLQIQATMATPNLFPLLGIQPLRGRVFTSAEDHAQSHVAVISEKLWRQKFNSAGDIVGRTVRLDDEVFTVVGVVRQPQALPAWADLWMPMSLIEKGLRSVRKFHPLEVVGRLRDGVTVEGAQAEMEGMARRLAAAHPDTNRTVGAVVLPLAGRITGSVRPVLLMVWGAVGLVLLISCANLAHLMMERAADRSREVAIRLSLGAPRVALVRQFLTESVLLAMAGGTLGLVLAAWISPLLRGLAEQRIPRLDSESFGWPVWMFGVVLAVACGLLFGIPASFQALRGSAAQAMKAGRGSETSFGRSRLGAVLVASEIALAVVVLAGAALLVRSFAGLLDENPGFRAQKTLAVNVVFPASRFKTWDAAGQFFRQVLTPRLRSVPGVEAVATANCAPFSLAPNEHTRFATRFGVVGRTFEPGRYPVAQLRWVSEDYFRVLGIPLKGGREFNVRDETQPSYIINETLARRFFPGQDSVGKQLLLDVVSPSPNKVNIVGVVGDVREFSLDEPPEPTLYIAATSLQMTLLIRTSGSAAAIGQPVEAALRGADAEASISHLEPLSRYVSESLVRERFALWLMGAFAGLAALLVATGVGGVVGYAVTRRIREFGIRAAVGASPRELLLMMVHETLATALPGIAAGLALAVAFGTLARTLLFRVSPSDPASLAAVTLATLAICTGAALLPARRASRVDPSIALRDE